MIHRFARGTCSVLAAAAATALLAGCGGGAKKSAADGATVAPATTAAPAPAAPTTVAAAPTTAPAPVATTAPSPTTVPAPVATTAPAATPVMMVTTPAGQTHSYVRPTTVYFSGDSTNIVDKVTWTTWGPAGAVGHGTWGQESCVPNCASGSVTDVATTLTLGSPVAGHFTTMTERAGSYDRTYTYPADWAVGAQ